VLPATLTDCPENETSELLITHEWPNQLFKQHYVVQIFILKAIVGRIFLPVHCFAFATSKYEKPLTHWRNPHVLTVTVKRNSKSIP
jgi:hypothetical protein